MEAAQPLRVFRNIWCFTEVNFVCKKENPLIHWGTTNSNLRFSGCRNAGFDPAVIRVDPFGNVLYFHADSASPLAWDIDHWFPCSSTLSCPLLTYSIFVVSCTLACMPTLIYLVDTQSTDECIKLPVIISSCFRIEIKRIMTSFQVLVLISCGNGLWCDVQSKILITFSFGLWRCQISRRGIDCSK